MAVTWKKDGQSVRGPSWAELVNQATNILGFSDPDIARVRGTDLQILEYFKLKHSGQIAKLTNWLTKLMDAPDDAINQSIIHQELVRLNGCSLFYTTNYDNFLERALELHGRSPAVIAVEAQIGLSSQDCEIIKFHGDLDHPDKIVMTESHYEQRLSLSTAMDYRLRADLLGRVVLFVGYSFRDPNVSYLFRLFTNEFFGKPGGVSGNRGYIIVPDPSDFEFQLFQERQITVIPVRGSKKESEIVSILQDMRS